MRIVRHPNIVELKAFYYSNGDRVCVSLVPITLFRPSVDRRLTCIRSQKDEVYLNLVLEYVPETVYRASRYFNKLKTTMPMLEVKLYIYQLFRSLAYIHSQGICHRDIKPQNLLLDPNTGILKLCDFGSAKILIENEPNVSYICSRYYRAPELIFGATNYTTKIGTYPSQNCHQFYFKQKHIHTNSFFYRCLVNWLCDGRIDAWTTPLPRRVGYRSTGRNHQGFGHPNSGTNSHHEPQLYGAQVPSNQASSLQ